MITVHLSEEEADVIIKCVSDKRKEYIDLITYMKKHTRDKTILRNTVEDDFYPKSKYLENLIRNLENQKEENRYAKDDKAGSI